MKTALIGALLTLVAAQPAFAQVHIRQYVMEDRRAYGGPGQAYVLISPDPPPSVLVIERSRMGTQYRRVVIDDRPPINSPYYVPILE